MNSSPRTTVFLDRDGTINENLPFPNVNRPEKMVLLPRAARGIKILNDIECRVIVVTNQAGINNPKNDLDIEMYEKVTDKFKKLLFDAAGARVDDIFCCPHMSCENCGCRKPQTGLYEAAKDKYGDMDFKKAFVVGDRTEDLIAGGTLGIKTILVRTGHGTETERLRNIDYPANLVVNNLHDAALKITELLKVQKGTLLF